MSFSVNPEAYDRFMGRYSVLLAPKFADFALIESGQSALDVGCGPGSLTGELVRRLGPSAVAAIDPSASFVDVASSRHPGVDVRRAGAEEIPFPDQAFDAVLAQLVVHFMKEPLAGIREMGRVTRRGGVVAACVWDHAGGEGPLAVFWSAARQMSGPVDDESELAGTRKGHLRQIFHDSGLTGIFDSSLTVGVEYESFDEWWEPFTNNVGPAGAYVAGLNPEQQIELRARCQEALPVAPFVVTGRAWVARGHA